MELISFFPNFGCPEIQTEASFLSSQSLREVRYCSEGMSSHGTALEVFLNISLLGPLRDGKCDEGEGEKTLDTNV